MPVKILTSYVADIKNFTRDPYDILSHSENGIVAIFIKNMPSFYVVSPQRLAQLLELEMRLSFPMNDMQLDKQQLLLHEKSANSPFTDIPIGKFAMYSEWKPDKDFQRIAALWGVPLMQPIKTEELTEFIDYWKAEGKIFHHMQWQQKLARSLQTIRTVKNRIKQLRCNDQNISEQESQIPPGFRG